MEFKSGPNSVHSSKLNETYNSPKNVDSTKNFDSKNIKNISNITKTQKDTDKKVIEPVLDSKELTKLEEALQEINDKLKGSENYVSYGIHEGTNRILIRLMDANTDEVIREYPSEKNLDIVAKVMEKVGLMFDAKK